MSAVRPLRPRPVAASVEELIAGATRREAFLSSDSKSGSELEHIVIDGEPYVLKHVHVDGDWTMRFSGDVGCHPIQVWSAGLMDCYAERIDHGVVGVAAGLGRNGWGGAVLMRDLSGDLVPPGDNTIPMARHLTYLDDIAGLSARMLGWRDEIGLVPLANRWSWFNQACLDVEEARGWPDPVPRLAAEGWNRFAERVPSSVLCVVDDLRRDPGPLVEAVGGTPTTFVHGDWKLGNVGTASDGRTVLIDWSYPGEAPPCYELAWYLSINQARLSHAKEDAITAFRASLDGHGATTDGWYERQLAICLLGSLVVFGWEKALGDDDELGWWCDRAREGTACL